MRYRAVSLFSLTIAFSGLAACNTMHGMGEDVEAGGAAVSHAASEAQSDMQEDSAHAIGNTGYTGESLAADARVNIERARALALAARPGTVTDQELEREAGGSGLRYSFDIRSAGVVYEVGVDANTGAILENAREGAHPD